MKIKCFFFFNEAVHKVEPWSSIFARPTQKRLYDIALFEHFICGSQQIFFFFLRKRKIISHSIQLET